MASTGSIGITRPMKKVTQVSPRKVSPTENRLRAARLAKLRARPQAQGPPPARAGAPDGAPCVAKGDRMSLFYLRHPERSRPKGGAVEGPVHGVATIKNRSLHCASLRSAPGRVTGVCN